MKLRKIGKGYYLMIKLNARDRKYIQGFNKCEDTRTIRNTDKFLGDMLALNLKAVYVMQSALILESQGKLGSKVINDTFDELDKSLENYEKVIDRYFKKFSRLLYGTKKSKQEKKGVRKKRVSRNRR
ncbi:MAG: hypothetical protein WBB67_15030 [bacterium]